MGTWKGLILATFGSHHKREYWLIPIIDGNLLQYIFLAPALINIHRQFPSTKGTLYKVPSLMGTFNRFPSSAESEHLHFEYMLQMFGQIFLDSITPFQVKLNSGRHILTFHYKIKQLLSLAVVITSIDLAWHNFSLEFYFFDSSDSIRVRCNIVEEPGTHCRGNAVTISWTLNFLSLQLMDSCWKNDNLAVCLFSWFKTIFYDLSNLMLPSHISNKLMMPPEHWSYAKGTSLDNSGIRYIFPMVRFDIEMFDTVIF